MSRLLFDRKARLACAAIWGVAWLGVGALLLLPLGMPGSGGSDLLGHFLLFGTMAFATVSFSRRPQQLAGLAIATVVLGGALEFAQSFVPYRTSDLTDAIANGAGGLVGCAVALLVLYG